VLSLLGALTYGELAAMKPAAGGLYVYIRDCFGRFPAFLFGWTLFFVISSGAVATLAVAFSAYLGEIVPLTPLLAKCIAVLMIIVVTVVNVLGTRKSSDLQNWTTAAKVIAILLMSIVLLWLGRGFRGASPILWPTYFNTSLVSGFGVAMISVLWAYEGWQFVTYNAGEVINAKRNFPLGLLIGTAALVAIYLISNLGYLAALGGFGASAGVRCATHSHPVARELRHAERDAYGVKLCRWCLMNWFCGCGGEAVFSGCSAWPLQPEVGGGSRNR